MACFPTPSRSFGAAVRSRRKIALVGVEKPPAGGTAEVEVFA